MTKTTKQKIIDSILKNKWSVILILLSLAILFSGFSFKFGTLSCEKSKPELPKMGSDK